MPGSLAKRAYRRLATPLTHLASRSRDRARLVRFLREAPASGTRCYVIVVPGRSSDAARTADRLLECGLEPVLVLNACSRRESARLSRTAPAVPLFRVSTLPGAPAKHGAVLTLLLEAQSDIFAVIDDDCAVFEPSVLRDLELSSSQLVLALDHPHFFSVNPRTGDRFPRTHFLMLNTPLLRSLMAKYGVTAEKCRRAPPPVASRLRELDLGPHNFPRPYLRFYDTLLLLIAVGLADGFTIRWHPAELSDIVHLPHIGMRR